MARRVTFEDLNKISSKNKFVSTSPLNAFRVVYIDSAGEVALASPNTLTSYQKVIGVLIEDSDGQVPAIVQLNGRVDTGSSSFVAGDPLFFDASGQLTSTEPTEVGGAQYIQQIGYAVSDSEIFIQLHTPLKFV